MVCVSQKESYIYLDKAEGHAYTRTTEGLRCANHHIFSFPHKKSPRCTKWRPPRNECHVGLDKPHPRHIKPTRRNWEGMQLRWEMRRTVHANETWKPSQVSRAVYANWIVEYDMNPRYVANHMKDALTNVRNKKRDGDPLFDLLFGPESDEDYAEFQAFIQTRQPGWEEPVFGKEKRERVPIIVNECPVI